MSVTDGFQFLLSLLNRIIPQGKITQVTLKIKVDKKKISSAKTS